ncbi:hypothetical protein LCGC14_1256490 [marine sediment metagenome]|uniref:Uncharacterized protein n=1 Tax=marine sediment metagenome TaxID=412755 RepID=A0A0F9L4S2_9ZZZZ
MATTATVTTMYPMALRTGYMVSPFYFLEVCLSSLHWLTHHEHLPS